MAIKSSRQRRKAQIGSVAQRGAGRVLHATGAVRTDIPHRRHVVLIAETIEPEDVAKTLEWIVLTQTVGIVIGVASGAVIKDGVEGISARILHGKGNGLIFVSALLVPATLKRCLGVSWSVLPRSVIEKNGGGTVLVRHVSLVRDYVEGFRRGLSRSGLLGGTEFSSKRKTQRDDANRIGKFEGFHQLAPRFGRIREELR